MADRDPAAVLEEFALKIRDVYSAFASHGHDYGEERFSSWRKRLAKFLDDRFPGESARLDAKLTHLVVVAHRGESAEDRFWRMYGKPCKAFLESLILDVTNGDYEAPAPPRNATLPSKAAGGSKRIFIVHGHDGALKQRIARFVEKLGYEAVILHERASKGKSIIEKIEEHTDVEFAIVLYSPDDLGAKKIDATAGKLKARARQNVVFEHGYLIARLGREKVVPLVGADVELPSDLSGVVYVEDTNWELELAREMKAAGCKIDLNALF